MFWLSGLLARQVLRKSKNNNSFLQSQQKRARHSIRNPKIFNDEPEYPKLMLVSGRRYVWRERRNLFLLASGIGFIAYWLYCRKLQREEIEAMYGPILHPPKEPITVKIVPEVKSSIRMKKEGAKYLRSEEEKKRLELQRIQRELEQYGHGHHSQQNLNNNQHHESTKNNKV